MGGSKTVALALGSGGARGYAHIGAVQVLQERGFDIVAVSGSSMGALVGGVFAAGRMDDYQEFVTGLGQFEVLRFLDVSLSSPGAIRGERLWTVMGEMLGGVQIEDLPVPYTAVAADLLARREIWFQRGPLDVAIRASSAIPSIFNPVVWHGRILVDGGLLNPIPLAPLSATPADVTIAVSVNDDRSDEFGDAELAPDALLLDGDDAEDRIDRIRSRVSGWLDRDALRVLRNRISALGDDDEPVELPEGEIMDIDEVPDEARPASWRELGLGKFDVINHAIETMQSALAQHKLAGYPPDVLVSVPKNACRSLDFHRAPEMIALGRRMTEETLDHHGVTARPTSADPPSTNIEA